MGLRVWTGDDPPCILCNTMSPYTVKIRIVYTYTPPTDPVAKRELRKYIREIVRDLTEFRVRGKVAMTMRRVHTRDGILCMESNESWPHTNAYDRAAFEWIVDSLCVFANETRDVFTNPYVRITASA